MVGLHHACANHSNYTEDVKGFVFVTVPPPDKTICRLCNFEVMIRISGKLTTGLLGAFESHRMHCVFVSSWGWTQP